MIFVECVQEMTSSECHERIKYLMEERKSIDKEIEDLKQKIQVLNTKKYLDSIK